MVVVNIWESLESTSFCLFFSLATGSNRTYQFRKKRIKPKRQIELVICFPRTLSLRMLHFSPSILHNKDP